MKNMTLVMLENRQGYGERLAALALEEFVPGQPGRQIHPSMFICILNIRSGMSNGKRQM